MKSQVRSCGEYFPEFASAYSAINKYQHRWEGTRNGLVSHQEGSVQMYSKAGHRSTLRSCGFTFWHRASVYMRLSAFWRREFYLCVSMSSRTMLAFENNVSCSSSTCSTPAFSRRLPCIEYAWGEAVRVDQKTQRLFKSAAVSTKSRPVCA